jgi:formylmethanofuran dehydrogenase subunit B
MAEMMTLEQVSHLLRKKGVMPSRELRQKMADAIDARLTQPAQAVDVHIDFLQSMTDDDLELVFALRPDLRSRLATRLSRAIGNAQAEACVRWSTDAIYEARGRFELTGDEMWLPTPPTKATPNAHE